MKLKDLIAKLQKIDGDLDVLVSPRVLMRSLTLNVDQGTTSDQTYSKTVNPSKRFPVQGVGLYQSAYGDDDGQRYVILMFDEEDMPQTNSEEFIN